MWVLIGLVLMTTVVEATQLIVPKDNMDENQLHEEILAAIPQCQPIVQPDGSKVDPGLCRVESTETEIRLTVPDEIGDRTVQALLAAHVPKPSHDATRRALIASGDAKLKVLGLTEDEIHALRGGR